MSENKAYVYGVHQLFNLVLDNIYIYIYISKCCLFQSLGTLYTVGLLNCYVAGVFKTWKTGGKATVYLFVNVISSTETGKLAAVFVRFTA